MRFEPLSFIPESEHDPEDSNTLHNRFYQAGVVGRLAMLAASLELERTDPEREEV
jgi:glutamate--cysteine ligase